MSRPLIIWGASGHAKVLEEFLSRAGFQLIALFDNSASVLSFNGIPVHSGKTGFLEWREATGYSNIAGVVAIGGGRGDDRIQLQRFMQGQQVEMITAVHPAAIVAANAITGAGCQILAGAVVGVEVVMGEGCIVNTRASVDHECVLGDGVHVAPGATLAGCVEVGRNSFIALGSVVLPRIKIGSNVIVGAGSVVTRDIPDNAVVMGQPARIVRWLPD